MDRMTRAKIESMLYEVRGGETGRPEPGPWDAEALARRYQLDPMIVRVLLEAEGAGLGHPAVSEGSSDADPNGATQVMSKGELGLR